MPTDVSYTLAGAYECELASTPQGWVIGAICLDAVDDRFVRNMDIDVEWERAKALLLPGATREEWTRTFVELRARLDLMESRVGEVTTLHSTTAEQYSGVAVAGGEGPAALWTVLDGGRWSAGLYVEGESRTLHSGSQILTGPAVARDAGSGLWCA